jgi:DNA-binding Lrp family transcriptional regulator
MDELDRAILTELQADGRVPNAELARRVSLSPAATHARVRRLERDGIVARYVALVDPEAAGYDLVCFVSVGLRGHQRGDFERFQQAVLEIPQVQECYFVTGESDFLLRVVVRNRRDLEHFAIEHLAPIPGISHMRTTIVLREVKRSTALPLDLPPEAS